MSTCKIYIKWKNVDTLWGTIKQISAFQDYIRNGDCKNIQNDKENHFKEYGRDSCADFGDIKKVRPFRYSTNFGDCNDDDYKKWACFIVNTSSRDNLPPPVFQSGTQEISPIFKNLTFSQDGKWSDISTTSDYLNMVTEYDATNINKLYVSQKVVGDSVTTYKIDINPIKTSLTNLPWSAISENSNLVDQLVEFYIEFDNTQTQYLLEPECWGPNNPCDGEDDDDEDDDDEDDTTKSNKASSTSFGVIIGFSIGGVLILFLVIMMARRAARRRLGMAPK